MAEKRQILIELKKGNSIHKVSRAWGTIRNLMSSRVRVTMRAKTEKGEVIYHRSTTKAEAHHQKIYDGLNLKTQVLKAKKFVG